MNLPMWAIELGVKTLELLIRLLCRLLGIREDAIEQLLDLAEEMG